MVADSTFRRFFPLSQFQLNTGFATRQWVKRFFARRCKNQIFKSRRDMSEKTNQRYQARIVPALQELQETDGYLKRDRMEQAAKRLGEPLYRLQAVASFFPHFRVTPPPAVAVHICRDVACHMAGAGQLIKDLKKYETENLTIEGTSCLGRCDRCPAAAIAVHHHDDGNGNGSHGGGHGGEHELYYH